MPALDSAATEPCRDPGIDPNPKIAVVEHRRALAECEDKRALAVGAYERVRLTFGLAAAAQALGN